MFYSDYCLNNHLIKQGLLSHESSLPTMLYPVPSSEKTKAVQYLIDHIPDEILSDIALIRENGKDWRVEHHHGFGMGVRNLL